MLVAGDATEGIQTFERMADRIRLVVLDANMPHAARALKVIQRAHPDLKVVASGANSAFDARLRLHARTLAGFVRTPFNASQLANAVKPALLANAVKPAL